MKIRLLEAMENFFKKASLYFRRQWSILSVQSIRTCTIRKLVYEFNHELFRRVITLRVA